MTVIGSRVTRCEIKGLDTAEVTVRAHWHHVLDDGRTIGSPWSREATVTVPRSNAILTTICNKVQAFVLGDEQAEWAQFPDIAGIQLRAVDFVRYAPDDGWGVAAFYHRLKANGSVINGFDGSILYTLRRDGFRVHGLGSGTAARSAQFEQFQETLFGYVESVVNARVLGL